ncbi:MAG: alpha/beta hydrolase [Rhodothermales bacterium]
MNRSQTVPTEVNKPSPKGPHATDATRARERLLEGLPVSEQRIHIGGVSTAVLTGGEGRPIILLHGPGGYAAQWFRVIPALTDTHQVIAPDLPGHGASEVPDKPMEQGDILNWLDELIEETCSTAPVLVGHVVGGAIGAQYAIRFDRRLKKLVLVDSLGLAPFEPKPEFGAAMSAFFADPNPMTHDQFWTRCAYDLDALRSGLGDRWADLKTYNVDRAKSTHRREAAQVLIQQFGIQAIPDAELAKINVPVSLIWGRNDLATDVSVAREVSSRFGWPLYVVDDAADDPVIEQPEAFVQALKQGAVASA